MNGLCAQAARWYRFLRADRMGRPHKPPAAGGVSPQTPHPASPAPASAGPAAGPAPGPAGLKTPPVPGHDDNHGGPATTVEIHRCGYMIITDHDKGEAEITYGECDDCRARRCYLCGFYLHFDPLRRQWVQRFERCPAHAGEEVTDGV